MIHSHLYDCYAFERLKLSFSTESYRESCLLMLLFFSCYNRCEPTTHKSVRCVEIGQILQKVEDQKPAVQMRCITKHPGFRSHCLDVWALKTAYYAFRQQHGADNRTGHEFIYFVHLSHYLSL